MPGQPKALDANKQAIVCSLVAAGVSLRQAARNVDCDPKSIRREAARNDDFRRQLDKAKSEASIQPLKTLQQAAKDDWRAAVSWMDRVDPDRFARPDDSIVTKREANQFVADLIEAIQRAVSSGRERKILFQLLTPAMPVAMRRRWNGAAMQKAVEQIKAQLDAAERDERINRDGRRWQVFFQLRDYLPYELQPVLLQNRDLLDPEEFFASQRNPAAASADAAIQAQDNHTENASPATNNAPPASPAGPYSGDSDSSPPDNSNPTNDLQSFNETPASE